MKQGVVSYCWKNFLSWKFTLGDEGSCNICNEFFCGKCRELPQTKVNLVCVDDMKHLDVLEMQLATGQLERKFWLKKGLATLNL